jgi:hypothetical protein
MRPAKLTYRMGNLMCEWRSTACLRHALGELPQRATHSDITDRLPFTFAKTAAA